MAHYQNQYGATTQTDEYGNPILAQDIYNDPNLQTDEYGNPIHRHDVPEGVTGTHGTGVRYGTTATTGTYGHGSEYGYMQEHEGGGHRRSDSSSSSEDDGMGGRRKKKGLKEKIKEKMPGQMGGYDERTHTSATASPGAYHDYSTEHPHREKKGMMEKIKEKLPGHH